MGDVNATNTTGSPGGELRFAPAGLPPLTLYSVSAADASATTLTVGLAGGAVGFSTRSGTTTAAIRAKLDAAREAEESLLVKTFGADRAGQGQVSR